MYRQCMHTLNEIPARHPPPIYYICCTRWLGSTCLADNRFHFYFLHKIQGGHRHWVNVTLRQGKRLVVIRDVRRYRSVVEVLWMGYMLWTVNHCALHSARKHIVPNRSNDRKQRYIAGGWWTSISSYTGLLIIYYISNSPRNNCSNVLGRHWWC